MTKRAPFDLEGFHTGAIDAERDYNSGRLSELGEAQAEITALNAMCRHLGLAPPPPGAWAADDAVQAWLADNSKAYIDFCLERAGIVHPGPLWMQAAGTLRLLGKI